MRGQLGQLSAAHRGLDHLPPRSLNSLTQSLYGKSKFSHTEHRVHPGSRHLHLYMLQPPALSPDGSALVRALGLTRREFTRLWLFYFDVYCCDHAPPKAATDVKLTITQVVATFRDHGVSSDEANALFAAACTGGAYEDSLGWEDWALALLALVPGPAVLVPLAATARARVPVATPGARAPVRAARAARVPGRAPRPVATAAGRMV